MGQTARPGWWEPTPLSLSVTELTWMGSSSFQGGLVQATKEKHLDPGCWEARKGRPDKKGWDPGLLGGNSVPSVYFHRIGCRIPENPLTVSYCYSIPLPQAELVRIQLTHSPSGNEVSDQCKPRAAWSGGVIAIAIVSLGMDFKITDKLGWGRGESDDGRGDSENRGAL